MLNHTEMHSDNKMRERERAMREGGGGVWRRRRGRWERRVE